MKTFKSFITKEIYHITRDPLTLLIMFILPIIMLLLLGFAVSTEIKNTPFAVLDDAKTQQSQELIDKISANEYFSMDSYIHTSQQIEEALLSGKVKLVIVIPNKFSINNLTHGNNAIQLIVDASNPNEASTIVNYSQTIMQQYLQRQYRGQLPVPPINANVKMLYNPQSQSAYTVVPGMIGLLMMLICAMMTSISVVREKEYGTMEILLVSPIKPIVIMFAKSIPYLIVAFLDVIVILLMAYYVFNVPIVGSIALILSLAFIYNFSALALGLLISNIANTQQTAMIISGVGLMLPTMLLSGFIFPISSMPQILQIVSHIIPARWFIDALRLVMIKGMGIEMIWQQLLILLAMTLGLMTISIKNFKNRLS